MYIEITTRCNMSCAHCGADAKAAGIDMTFDVFKKAVRVCKEAGATRVTIGGGEPTIHPEFMKMLDYAVEQFKITVSIISNGSNTATVLKLANMTEKGIIAASISQDEYHDPIDPRVVKRYTELKTPYFKDHDAIKKLPNVINVGRGKNIAGAVEDRCLASAIYIAADGNIYACGCKTELLGNVDNYKLPKIDCEGIDSKKYSCLGYCSNYGHRLVNRAEQQAQEDHIEHLESELAKQIIVTRKAKLLMELRGLDLECDKGHIDEPTKRTMIRQYEENSGLSYFDFMEIYDSVWTA
jgi:MoaA/NifB/PqqE/SkfB family radical SAM enzyme